MSKILAVFGATGTQGGSVVDYVLNDSELSKTYKIRAITRDTNSRKAKELEKKVEVVAGDVTDRTSLETALKGVHTVFAVTTPDFSPNALEVEFNVGKTIADVAVEQGVQYFIFSTLTAVAEISGGKYTKVTAFDAKAKIEQYVRTLPIKSAFFAGGFFMENFETQPFLNPKQKPDGTWVLARPNSPQTKLPYLSAGRDIGRFVGAILAEPDKYQGKVFHAATRLYSLEELAAILSKATGKHIRYEQVSLEEFVQSLPFIPELFGDAFQFLEDYGYFGPGTESMVAWAAENARGKLETFEEFFERNSLKLE